MLCDASFLQAIPGLNNPAMNPIAYLNRLLLACDQAIKSYCKQELEMRNYQEFLNGTQQNRLVIQQLPVWQARTFVSSNSDQQVLPQSTIYVNSTLGFSPGIYKNPGLLPPTVTVKVGTNKYTTFSYTSLQAANPNANPPTTAAFTGCTGGSGILVVNSPVWTPSIWVDPNGFSGQNPTGFGDGTLIVQGSNFKVDIDNARGTQGRAEAVQGGKSRRGTITKISGGQGGAGGGIGAFFDAVPGMYRGKLASYQKPVWPFGDGNIKVCYTGGYDPIPHDLKMACAMLVANVARILPNGVNMSSESLGGYSYSALYNGEDPELGEIRRTLAYYRENSWAA